jgi:hypothetical protein
MFPIKAIPVTTPGIDLSLFRNIVSVECVNEVDARRNTQPLSKFAELVESSFPDDIDPYQHIYQSFYFELPCQPFLELTNMQLLSTTSVMEGLVAKGYLSASLATWVEFVTRASKESCGQYLRVFANQVFNVLRNFPPFQVLKFQSYRDQTFGLVKHDPR